MAGQGRGRNSIRGVMGRVYKERLKNRFVEKESERFREAGTEDRTAEESKA